MSMCLCKCLFSACVCHAVCMSVHVHVREHTDGWRKLCLDRHCPVPPATGLPPAHLPQHHAKCVHIRGLGQSATDDLRCHVGNGAGGSAV